MLMLGIAAVNRHPNSERVRLRTQGERLRRFRLRHRRWSIDDSRLGRSKRLNQRRRRARRFVCVANEFQQMMIFDMLNLVCQPDKTAVDVIQSAAIELVAQLFAAYAE